MTTQEWLALEKRVERGEALTTLEEYLLAQERRRRAARSPLESDEGY